MTTKQLLERLHGIEWNDFEAKEAKSEVPKSVWETVSAFSNTSGGWIVFGVIEKRMGHIRGFEVQGVSNPEKIEQDFVCVLRSGGKFNQRVQVHAEKHNIDGKVVLAFYIPMAEFKPVYIGVPTNTFVRVGSGDQRATEYEIRAMQRDQAFGKKSNEAVFGSSFKDLDMASFKDYRNYIKAFNPELRYNALSDTEFAVKTGILSNGLLTVGGLFMLGKIEAILNYNPDFLIDYIEIPGTTISTAANRYTFRMADQENIWEYYKAILQRLRLRADNPYSPLPDGVAPDDNSRLYCLREALVNFLAHADYFSEIHSTVRVFDNHISFQNPGGFPVNLDIVGRTIVSQPRNPNILRFFKLARISENGGYGIDKILQWKEITGCDVSIESDITKSEVSFSLPDENVQRHSTPIGIESGAKKGIKNFRDEILALIRSNPGISITQLMEQTGNSRRTIDRMISSLKKDGFLERIGLPRNGYWKVL